MRLGQFQIKDLSPIEWNKLKTTEDKCASKERVILCEIDHYLCRTTVE